MNPTPIDETIPGEFPDGLGNITYLSDRAPRPTPEDFTLRPGLKLTLEYHTVKVLSVGTVLVRFKATRDGFKPQTLVVPRAEFEAMLAKHIAEATG